MQSNAEEFLIKVDRVSKTFESDNRKVKAIKEVSVGINEGDFITIVGPSGCGKSTLLKMIAGYFSPTSGNIYLNGETIKGPGRERAVVFQEDAVFPWMNVEDNLAYGLKRRNVSASKIEETVDHYLELVGLLDCKGLYPKELSGGMKKRVDIARAYANDPEVLLMDEPFGSLDVLTKSEMQDELLGILRAESKTVIFVTHDLEEAIFLSDKVVFLTEGPSTIDEILKVPFERPREQHLKTTPKFQQFRENASEELGILT